MNLLIDIGNSRIKWASSAGMTLSDHAAFEYKKESMTDLLKKHWHASASPDAVYISNVAGADVAKIVSAVIRQKWQTKLLFVKAQRQCCGVVNAYKEASQLGVDRWLAIIAAWNKYRAPVCVIDCGTALTIDGVSAGGQHLGGLIIPGLRMMQDMLSRETHGIQVDRNNQSSLGFGRSTTECITNGANCAIVSLVERMAGQLESEQGSKLCRIITGGYAAYINDLIMPAFDLEPHLVLNGLKLIADGQ